MRTSARQLVGRVVDTMTRWGREGGYFASDADAETFRDELVFLLLNQYASFNSPVWFNCGIEAKPQCSACFINSVEDTMDSILSLAKTEGMLFKWGSGTGSNLSPLRSSRERLSGGGIASGPVSFMKGYDAFAGVIRSGGKTRRAAKMVILNVDHPDIIDFIECKMREEKKAWALIDAGYDPSFNGEAYASIFYQNANHSVRVTDEFMKAVLEDKEWVTPRYHRRGAARPYQARDILYKISREHARLRRPGYAVRHDHQPLAHLERLGSHQRVEPLFRVHVPRRQRLQSGLVQLDEVPETQRSVRRRFFPQGDRRRDHRHGDHRR